MFIAIVGMDCASIAALLMIAVDFVCMTRHCNSTRVSFGLSAPTTTGAWRAGAVPQPVVSTVHVHGSHRPTVHRTKDTWRFATTVSRQSDARLEKHGVEERRAVQNS